MSQKAPTIKLGGAPYEDATQASIHYQTPALLKVMFRMHEGSVKDLTVAVLRTMPADAGQIINRQRLSDQN